MDDSIDDIDLDEHAAKPRRPGLPVEPRRLLWLLAERRTLLVRAFVVAALVAVIGFFLLPARYESSAQLLYEGIPLLDPDERARTADAFVHSALASSRLREVRERLGWNVALEDIRSQVTVELEASTSMRIVGDAGSPEDALALTQAVVDAFLAGQRAFNQERLERLRTENELALQHAKERRERALEAYEAFREKSGEPNVLDMQVTLLERSNEVRAQAEEAAVEAAAQKAGIEELEQAQRELPRQIISSAKKGSPVDTPLARARSELAEARASLSEEHPRVRALQQRVASLQAQRGNERTELGEQTLIANPARSSVDQQIATARGALAAAQERESALRVLLSSIKEEAESLVPEEGEARQIVRELEVANERLEELNRRAASIRDASVRPLTGFRVLSAPMLPEEAKRSGFHVFAVAMLPVLTVLMFALVILVRRLRTLTVEAPREVAWWGNGPVLGTSVWPRDPEALDTFVDELQDQGMYGAGRTLVVPATENEREIACSFAMRLAEAPWLAAAILDVGDGGSKDGAYSPLVTPAPPTSVQYTPGPAHRSRRLSSQGSPSVATGRVITTPSSRPPRKKTVIGLPAVKPSSPAPDSGGPPETPTAPTQEAAASPPQPSEQGTAGLHSKRNVRATIRMVVPSNGGRVAEASAVGESPTEEDAFLLTRPVPVTSGETSARVEASPRASADSYSQGASASASNAAMRAAVRLLGEEDHATAIRRSQPPVSWVPGGVRGVALAWNGPLSGPVLRRAARLAHRVMVVVSSGMSGIELARVPTRLGRQSGFGYVLVNVGDAYVDLEDRVGPVEAFWQAPREGEAGESKLR